MPSRPRAARNVQTARVTATRGPVRPGRRRKTLPLAWRGRRSPTHPAPPIGELLASYSGGDCFAALAQPSASGDTLRVTALLHETGRLEDFAETLARQDFGEAARRIEIDAGHIGRALAFLAAMPGYPGFPLRLRLDDRRIASGDTLTGTIEGIGERIGEGIADGAVLDLLLVDDEGRVQQISQFLERDGGTARFALPLTLSGRPVETAQLLIALALPAALIHTQDGDGAAADGFFDALADALATKGLTGAFAVAPVFVGAR